MQKLTKEWFETSFDGQWTRSLLDVPHISEEEILRYLVDRRAKRKDSLKEARGLKTVKAYRFFMDGHVQKISVCCSTGSEQDLMILRAQVLASMKQTYYKVYMAVEKDQGRVAGAYCECVAGKGESCNHAAALLLAIAHFRSNGLDTIPDDKTCTDIQCRWKGQAAKKTAPASWDKIQVVKHEVGQTKKSKATFQVLNFDPRHPDDRDIDKEAFSNLCQALRSSDPSLPFCRYAEPLPPIPDADNQHDGDSSFVHPTTLEDIKAACNRVKASLQLSAEVADNLQMETRGQNASTSWHESRRLRLTASIFHRVINMRASTNPKNFLRDKLHPNSRFQTKAMKLGLEREDGAAQRYKLQRELEEGESLTLSEVGLRVSADKGFLGASTDRVAVDSCGVTCLVEIKNPNNTWLYDSLTDVPAKQQCLVIDDSSRSGVKLNKKHAYHTQIQGQLYVYNAEQCDFVLCTKNKMYVERVYRDEDFIRSMVHKLEDFYDNIFLPEVVYPRVKFNLDPLDLRKV